MKTSVKTLLVAALMAAPLSLVGTGDASANVGRWIDANDLNNDGVVSRAELRERRVSNFSRMDSNNNGYLDDGDLSGFVARRIGVDRFAAYIDLVDANGDGAASFDEVAYGPMPLFDASDANHDNVLTYREIEAFLYSFDRN